MRHLQRAVIAAIGVALVGLVPLSGGSASAESSRSYEAGATAPAVQTQTRAEARRIRRSVSINFKCNRCARWYFFTGTCPKCNRSTVLLQRAKRFKGTYRTVRRVRTNGKGYYTFIKKQVSDRGWWRVKVNGTNRFYPAYSKKICVARGGC